MRNRVALLVFYNYSSLRSWQRQPSFWATPVTVGNVQARSRLKGNKSASDDSVGHESQRPIGAVTVSPAPPRGYHHCEAYGTASAGSDGSRSAKNTGHPMSAGPDWPVDRERNTDYRNLKSEHPGASDNISLTINRPRYEPCHENPSSLDKASEVSPAIRN